MRRSLLIIFVCALAIPALIAGITAMTFALRTHSELERAAMDERSKFIMTAYHQQLRNLEALATDWAQWDDAVEFLGNPTLESMRSWVVAFETFGNQHLALTAYVRSDLSLAFGAVANLATTKVEEFTDAPDNELTQIIEQVRPGADFQDNRTGIFVWHNRPYAFSSVPVMGINHDRKGRGFLLLARLIDEGFWQRISGENPVSVSSLVVASSHTPLPEILVDEDVVYSHTRLKCTPPTSSLQITISSTRGLFRQVAEARTLFMVVMGVVGLLSMSATWVLIHRKLTRPVEQLQKDAYAIQTTGDFSLRLHQASHDEIGKVCTSVNAMLGRLEEVHQDVVLARKDADRASRAKTSFISKVSHELRTPIFSIQGYLRMLKKAPLDDKGKEQLSRLGDAADGLLMVVNSILDFAELSGSGMQMRASEFEVGEVLHEVALAQMPLLRDKHQLAVVVKVSNALPTYIKLDERRFGQVVHHLLSNGIKFTERGNVEVVVGPVPEGITVVVRDSGVGMSQDQLRQTLEAFEQFEDTSNRTFDGLGLGLTLSRKILDLFRGTLTLESVVGRGTTATAFIPVRYGEVNTAHPGEKTVFHYGEVSKETSDISVPVEPHQKLHVLVAEDELANQIIIKSMLEELGHTVVCVDNGLQMGEILQRAVGDPTVASSTRPFDIIITDLDMPGCSGVEAIRRLRTVEEGLGSHPKIRIPVLVVTANDSSAAAIEAKDAGSDGFVIKPIAPNQLAQALAAARATSQREGSKV